MSNKDDFFMRKAIYCAKQATRAVIPNPKVGAVIVKNGHIISTGYHRKSGQHHAEIIALLKAGKNARNSTLYVTLEPCSSFGKTPPCVNEIIKSGIKKVVIGSADPNPVNHEKSTAILRQSGIEVVSGVLKDKCDELIEDFRKYIVTGLPFVTAKVAQSADGKISTTTGDSKWISNEASRKKVQFLRANSDAVMVGVNTVIKDNPSLTIRISSLKFIQPWRIIIDPFLIIPETANVLNDIFFEKTVLVVKNEIASQSKARNLSEKGIKIIGIESDSDIIDPKSILSKLAQFPIMSILIEGGPATLGSFLDCQSIDKIHIFIAPMIIGGANAPGSFAGKGTPLIKDAIKLDKISWKKYNTDILLTGYPIYKQTGG